MTTSPDEASVQENRNPVEPGELPIAVQMRLKDKREIISRLHEVKGQVLAITPAKQFYGNPKGDNKYDYNGSEHLRDIAADIDKAIKAVERL